VQNVVVRRVCRRLFQLHLQEDTRHKRRDGTDEKARVA
jgi:hypothetical protein